MVGQVRGLHGLRGTVRVEILSDDPRRFARGRRLYLEGEAAPLTVSWSQVNPPGMLVRFREVDQREAAEALRERYLEVEVDSDALPAGAFYWHEVEGTPVRTTEGELLGTVEEILRVGEGEVFIVRGGPRGEILIPAVSAVITELAPREGRIVVDREALGLDDELPRPKVRGRLTSRARRREQQASRPPAAAGESATPDDAARNVDEAPNEGVEQSEDVAAPSKGAAPTEGAAPTQDAAT